MTRKLQPEESGQRGTNFSEPLRFRLAFRVSQGRQHAPREDSFDIDIFASVQGVCTVVRIPLGSEHSSICEITSPRVRIVGTPCLIPSSIACCAEFQASRCPLPALFALP